MMKKIILASFLIVASLSSFAQSRVSGTCKDLQTAEAKILSAAYYEMPQDVKAFCYFLSRAVSSSEGRKIGLDGLAQGGIEFCVNTQSKVSIEYVAKETSTAIKHVKNCFSEIGQ
jgi:hypothetical protein